MKHFFALLAASVLSISAWADAAFSPLDRQTARALVDPAKHSQPTIVALWSSECSHCKQNLALYARLVKQNKRLRLVTIAAEPVWSGLAVPLDRLGVPGKRYAYGDDAPEAIAHAIDPDWRGELPRTLFFDGRGGRQAVSGVVDTTRARELLGLGARR
ncbi:MAG: TlpA family protein disulfide reductase [Rhodocyclaceae bacterium]